MCCIVREVNHMSESLWVYCGDSLLLISPRRGPACLAAATPGSIFALTIRKNGAGSRSCVLPLPLPVHSDLCLNFWNHFCAACPASAAAPCVGAWAGWPAHQRSVSCPSQPR